MAGFGNFCSNLLSPGWPSWPRGAGYPVQRATWSAFFCLRAAVKACLSFSPQLRAGVQSMLVKCRSKVGGDRNRDISKIVVQINHK